MEPRYKMRGAGVKAYCILNRDSLLALAIEEYGEDADDGDDESGAKSRKIEAILQRIGRQQFSKELASSVHWDCIQWGVGAGGGGPRNYIRKELWIVDQWHYVDIYPQLAPDEAQVTIGR